MGKDDAKTAPTTKTSARTKAAKAKAGQAAKPAKGPSSGPGRRIVTDTYTSQATLSDFVVACYCLVTVTAGGFLVDVELTNRLMTCSWLVSGFRRN